ncbi:hypothetical protein CP532_4426 [Ophiocordyceps camponoti-leonardi (nom. inval.)]|nr:hypothetical protein CP532_4426 [Ophiocordyceps camponoti-leonardi (nom. inval.)]
MTIIRLPSTHPLPLPLRRLASSSSSSSSSSSFRAFTPEPAKQFVFKGKLKTTPENVLFFQEHDIEPDNSRLRLYQAGPELKKVSKEYGITFFHSPKHILSPFALVYFDPRGHPLAASVKAKLVKKVRDEPLWVQCTSVASPTSAIVHTLAKRRITAAVHGALVERGYDLAPGKGASKTVWGTLYMKISDPLKASAQSPARLGLVVAEAIDNNWPCRVGGGKPRHGKRP